MSSSSNPSEGSPEQSSSGLWAAVGFWITTLAATALVAAVVLSPRLLEIRQLERKVARLTEECLRVDRQNEKLASLLKAIRHDPQLLRQLAEWELQGRPPDQAPALLSDMLHTRPVPSPPPTMTDRLLELFATDPVVAQVGFGTAGVLYIIALVCYRDQASRRSPVEASPNDTDTVPRRPLMLRDERALSDDECLF